MNNKNNQTVMVIQLGPDVTLAISGEEAIFLMGSEAMLVTRTQAMAFLQAVSDGKSFTETMAILINEHGLKPEETQVFGFEEDPRFTHKGDHNVN
jgi:hypothetical protein